MKLLYFRPCGIAFDAREAGVDDIFDARTVSEVSATLVASTMRRFAPEG